MSIIYILLPIALILGFCFLIAFLVATSRGQYDELDSPAYRMLVEEDVVKK